MRILVTGAAGFIGMHVSLRLLGDGHTVVGADGFTPYYDQNLKRARFSRLISHPRFTGHEAILEETGAIHEIVRDTRADAIIHLAAQAGVRYSLEAPESYINSNVVGTFKLLEAVRAHPVKHLLLASTSSVYGSNTPPFRESDRTDHPLSIYAATKKSTEDIAHSYAHLFGLPTTMLRFFTVYGPWYRPDMALFKFTKAILEGRPIDLYNHGEMRRDFTYIDDVVEALCRLVDRPPSARGDSGSSPVACYRAVNIAGGAPVELRAYVAAIEDAIGRKAAINSLDMQPGDVEATAADTGLLQTLTGFRPQTPIQIGIARFVEWYRDYYRA